jgi:hypothetical protein
MPFAKGVDEQQYSLWLRDNYNTRYADRRSWENAWKKDALRGGDWAYNYYH